MIHLGICNTILVVKDENGNLVYNASSPDELALANGAKFCGFQYVGTDEKGFLVIRFRK
jgi:phospholipid-transporting ATPase